LAETTADPVAPPKQITGEDVAVAVNAVGCVTVVVADEVQPFASVTITVYVPAESPVALDPFPPLGDHAYVYGVVPPVGVTVAEPVLPPKQSTGDELAEVVSTGGCVITTEEVDVHPLRSVTVTT
jgi:hypothetical protein